MDTKENFKLKDQPVKDILPSKKEKIVEAGLELQKAINTWEELSKDCHGLSADEQMLQDMQVLLKKLKNQIEVFK